uniref:Uncharacterized protein n=1 Tax=Octopus bimaculoides TaxID=37653 RepID=A0A0L8G4T0_OCTBM
MTRCCQIKCNAYAIINTQTTYTLLTYPYSVIFLRCILLSRHTQTLNTIQNAVDACVNFRLSIHVLFVLVSQCLLDSKILSHNSFPFMMCMQLLLAEYIH